MKLTPYLHFAGNAEEALNFYASVFGGRITALNRFSVSPTPVDDDYNEKIIHARLVFDDNMIMISDVMKGNLVSTDGNIDMNIEIDNVEKTKSIFNGLAETGTIILPLQKQFWGATFGMLKDKFGVRWMFNSEDKQ